jgi:hypothetical protein
MFGRKREEIVFTVPKVENKKCRVCEKEVPYYQIAYQDDVCWNCFRRTVITIAKNQETIEDTQIILDLLLNASKYYRGG